jgi:hypothetical protein
MKPKSTITFLLAVILTIFICPSASVGQAIVYLDMQDPANLGYFDKWEAQVNARNLPAPSETNKTDAGLYNGTSFYYERSQEEGLEVFTSAITGKKALRSTLADGRAYGGGTYDRAELNLNGKPGGNFKVGRLMEVVWSGYFESTLPTVSEFVAAMQLHGHDVASPANGVYIHGNLVSFRDRLVTGWHDFMNVSEMVNKVVSFRMTINCNDTNGYLKFEYKKEGANWATVLERNTGATKNPDGTTDNYIKLAGMYDYYRTLVDPNLYSRGKSYSLVTTNATITDITNAQVSAVENVENNHDSHIQLTQNSLAFLYSYSKPTSVRFSIYSLQGMLIQSSSVTLEGDGAYTINVDELCKRRVNVLQIIESEKIYSKKLLFQLEL